MADITASIALISSKVTGHGDGTVEKVYELTFDDGADWPAADLAVDFTAATNPNQLPRAGWGRVPDAFEVIQHPPGYVAVIVPGVALDDWAITLYGAGDGNAFHAISESDGTLALEDATMRIKVIGKNV